MIPYVVAVLAALSRKSVIGLRLESNEMASPVDVSADDHAVVIDVPRIRALRAREVDRGEFAGPRQEATGIAEGREAVVGGNRSDHVAALIHPADGGAGAR